MTPHLTQSDRMASPKGRCAAVVVTCIDYRFVDPLQAYLAGTGLTGAADVVALPGGALAFATEDRDAVLRAVLMARELHRPSEVILCAHEDCGRIGGSRRFPGREAELSTIEEGLWMAEEMVRNHVPDLPVRLVRFEPGAAVHVAGLHTGRRVPSPAESAAGSS